MLDITTKTKYYGFVLDNYEVSLYCENMNETIFIYALCDKLNQVRYIGRTCNVKYRKENHRNNYAWVKSHFIIEIVEEKNAIAREAFWIQHYRDNGSDLENIHHIYGRQNRVQDRIKYVRPTQEQALLTHRLIKKMLKQKNISFADIASIAGTTRNAIYLVSRGKICSRQLRRAFCNELGLHPVLLGWHNIATEYEAEEVLLVSEKQ